MIIHDYTLEFVSFFNTIRNKSDQEKLSRFYLDLYPVFPSFYKLRLDKWEKQGLDTDTKLLEEFAEFESYEPEFVKRRVDVKKQLVDAVISFQARFPDFSSDFEVHILHSLKEMDGGIRKLGEQNSFILGVDMMIRFHSWEDETAFFHHELLHRYMQQLHKDNDWHDRETVLHGVWEEGLAVYVSHLLNPEATYTELTLNLPQSMRENVWDNLTELTNDLAANLSKPVEDGYEKYFTPWPDDDSVPGRSAYFIGYMAIIELMKEYPLRSILKPHSEDELSERVKTQLRKLPNLSRSDYFPAPPRLL